MSNSYSCGYGYNYRRSPQREGGSCPASNIRPAMSNHSHAPREDYPEFPMPIAMGYVPVQRWSKPMELCCGLKAGTIFCDLEKPFCGKGGACR